MPIGILFLALAFELIKRWLKRDDLDFAIRIALVLGSVSAVFAAITGWFLAEEGGYESSALLWHKWMGVSLVVVSLTILIIETNKSEKIRKLTFPSMLIMAVLITLTGHFGGNMTHGEDYLFTKPPEEIAFSGDTEEIQVYGQLIAPIFSRKCNSCHNESKTKGDLVMTNQAGLFAGGKSGPIFDFEKVGDSEMLKRIHLPLIDEHHMPPKGKLQLTENEISLLKWWIKNEACMECIVGETKNVDEIQAVLDEYTKKEPTYDVELLDQEEIEELRESGISVTSVAAEHPMIIVNLAYRQDLDEPVFKKLKEVSENVLELNLAGSNMDDRLASFLPPFSNLNKLQLQNTAISDRAIEYLVDLRNLKSLNLYQTTVSDRGLKKLEGISSLKNLYVWNTEVSPEGVEQLERVLAGLDVQHELNADIFENNAISAPEIKALSPFFKDQVTLELSSEIPGATFYYTLDGTQPDTTSNLYSDPIQVDESAIFQSVAYKEGWKMSEPSAMRLMKVSQFPKQIKLRKPPNEAYAASGAQSLTDGKKGTTQFTDGKWIGYQGEDIEVSFELDNSSTTNSLIVSALSDQGSWIFFPKGIEIFTSNNGTNFTKAANLDIPLEKPELLLNATDYFEIPLEIKEATHIKVIIRSHLVNPEWHANPGEKCWVFIDEIVLI